jgi:dTDP-4-amino-4,6-dideoxygalactose transaminase
LERWQEIQERRQVIWDTYHRELASWCAQNSIRQPVVPPDCQQAYHMYYLLLPSLAQRQELIAHLRARGILSVFHYLPLDQSTYAREWFSDRRMCPVTQDVSDRVIRLPFYNGLSASDQGRVIEAVLAFAT